MASEILRLAALMALLLGCSKAATQAPASDASSAQEAGEGDSLADMTDAASQADSLPGHAAPYPIVLVSRARMRSLDQAHPRRRGLRELASGGQQRRLHELMVSGVSAAVLKSSGFELILWDDDSPAGSSHSSDAIVRPTDWDLNSGELVVDCPDSLADYVSVADVSFEFTRDGR